MTLNTQQLVNNQFKCYALTITVRGYLGNCKSAYSSLFRYGYQSILYLDIDHSTPNFTRPPKVQRVAPAGENPQNWPLSKLNTARNAAGKYATERWFNVPPHLFSVRILP